MTGDGRGSDVHSQAAGAISNLSCIFIKGINDGPVAWQYDLPNQPPTAPPPSQSSHQTLPNRLTVSHGHIRGFYADATTLKVTSFCAPTTCDLKDLRTVNMTDEGEGEELVERDAYLDDLIDMSPSTDSLMAEVRKSTIYKGF